MSYKFQGNGPRSLGRLVDQQVIGWRLRNQELRANQPAPAYAPVITVSREASAHGADIARAVAKELGFELWDEALVTRLAERAGAGEHSLRVVDERERGLIEDVLAASLLDENVSSSTYRSLLERTIHELGDAGGAVIVGRGANFVLPAEKAFSVRIVCPREHRITRHAARCAMPRAEAEQAISVVDRDRVGFVRQFTGKDPTDVTAYDLVVNTGRLGVSEAAHVVAAAYRARYQPAAIVLRRASIASRHSLPDR
jgi:cytidylate kinase